MCSHRQPGDLEDCTLRLAESGRLVCVQHQPITRQRADDLDLLVAAMQRHGGMTTAEFAERLSTLADQ